MTKHTKIDRYSRVVAALLALVLLAAACGNDDDSPPPDASGPTAAPATDEEPAAAPTQAEDPSPEEEQPTSVVVGLEQEITNFNNLTAGDNLLAGRQITRAIYPTCTRTRPDFSFEPYFCETLPLF